MRCRNTCEVRSARRRSCWTCKRSLRRPGHLGSRGAIAGFPHRVLLARHGGDNDSARALNGGPTGVALARTGTRSTTRRSAVATTRGTGSRTLRSHLDVRPWEPSPLEKSGWCVTVRCRAQRSTHCFAQILQRSTHRFSSLCCRTSRKGRPRSACWFGEAAATQPWGSGCGRPAGSRGWSSGGSHPKARGMGTPRG